MARFNLLTVMTGLIMSYYTGNLVELVIKTYKYSSLLPPNPEDAISQALKAMLFFGLAEIIGGFCAGSLIHKIGN